MSQHTVNTYSDTDLAPGNITAKNIRFVMVNTSHPGNIGAAARALKTMSLSELVLVSPKKFPAEEAIWRAAGGQDILDRVRVVDTLDDAIANCGLVVGTSARGRRIPWPLLTPRAAGDKIWAESKQHEVAILFGREDRGLTNEELHRCHLHVHIPGNPEYSVLNIASALQIIAYEIRMSWLNELSGGPLEFDDWDMPLADPKQMEHYFTHLEETLIKIGFLNTDNPRQTMTRMRRLYNRVRMDEMELNMLRGMLTALQNFIHVNQVDVDDRKPN